MPLFLFLPQADMDSLEGNDTPTAHLTRVTNSAPSPAPRGPVRVAGKPPGQATQVQGSLLWGPRGYSVGVRFDRNNNWTLSWPMSI